MEDQRSILKKVFGYDSFRPGQEEIVKRLLGGQDVLAVMPTGAGKSICYQVPALLLPGITLVVSPLVSLMKDQVGALVQAGVAAAFLNNSLTDNQKALMLHRAREGWYKIIYVAPERLETEKKEPVPEYKKNPEMEMPTVEVNGQECVGMIEIPALGLKLPIISEWSDAKLKKAPCRYSGSAYLKNMIIAGHNYRTHFSGIKRLNPGDSVVFTDADGNVFSYDVAEIETVGGYDIEKMEAGDWDLTLFTCTNKGKARAAVRCREIEE